MPSSLDVHYTERAPKVALPTLLFLTLPATRSTGTAERREVQFTISCVRHFVHISVAKHRETLFKLLLGDHNLGVEVLRRQKSRKEGRLSPVL